jgi:hypothetical protein
MCFKKNLTTRRLPDLRPTNLCVAVFLKHIVTWERKKGNIVLSMFPFSLTYVPMCFKKNLTTRRLPHFNQLHHFPQPALYQFRKIGAAGIIVPQLNGAV